MFSVCIPVYRYDVRALVRELLRQAEALTPSPEILIYDDASPHDRDYGQEELRGIPGITYRELPTNLGRAAIRNAMVRAASTPWVLLLDADGWPAASFLATYQNALKNLSAPPAGAVIVGGRSYAPHPPSDARCSLHWHYGRRRESRPVAQREKAGWRGFQSNNFLAPGGLLRQYPFPENHRGYGHEDTYWGQLMERAGYGVVHVDNPVTHLGLEPADVFLHKQREAIENLFVLRKDHPWLQTRLTKFADRRPWLASLAPVVPTSWLTKHLKENPEPNLIALDLLKVKWWLALANR